VNVLTTYAKTERRCFLWG